MKGQIQFTQTTGDGLPSTYRYVEGDLEMSKLQQGQLYYFDYGSETHLTLKFTVLDLSIDCNFIQVNGTNKDGYGKVSFLMSTNGFWNDRLEENRLRRVYARTAKYFRETHGLDEDEDIDFISIARENLKKEKRCKKN